MRPRAASCNSEGDWAYPHIRRATRNLFAWSRPSAVENRIIMLSRGGPELQMLISQTTPTLRQVVQGFFAPFSQNLNATLNASDAEISTPSSAYFLMIFSTIASCLASSLKLRGLFFFGTAPSLSVLPIKQKLGVPLRK